MRTLFLLILLAGLAMAFGYPAALERLGGADLGRYHVYDAEKGPQTVEVPLKAADAPVGVSIEMTTTGSAALPTAGAILTLVVDAGGQSVLAKPLSFAGATPRETNPQTAERVYTEAAGVLARVDDAAYRFRVGPGDAEGVTVRSADVVLQAKRGSADPRVQPVGLAVTAVGFIGFVLALRRRAAMANPNSQPPGPRWGRGG